MDFFYVPTKIYEKSIMQNNAQRTRTRTQVTHCIFDLDGILLASNIYDRAIIAIVSTYGKSMTDKLWKKIQGHSEVKSAEIIIKTLNLLISNKEFVDRVQKLSCKLLKQAPLMKGAERLLRYLQENDIPCAIVSGSYKKIVDMQVEKNIDLFSHFSHCVCGLTDPEVKRGKPAPDIFLVAASRFSDPPAPSKCLAFQSNALGVIAASRAGMQSIVITAKHVPEECRRIATQVLKSLEDFRPEEFGLPPIDYY